MCALKRIYCCWLVAWLIQSKIYSCNQLLVDAVFNVFSSLFARHNFHCFWSRSFHIVVVQLAITQRVLLEQGCNEYLYNPRRKEVEWNAFWVCTVHALRTQHHILLLSLFGLSFKGCVLTRITHQKNTTQCKSIIEINKSWTGSSMLTLSRFMFQLHFWRSCVAVVRHLSI